MRRLASILAALAACAIACPSLQAAETEPRVSKRACLSPAETREEIKAHNLREPFAVLKYASTHFKAEALSAKLCRIDDDFVYEIALLHRDGKFVHAHVSAVTGKIVEVKRPVFVAKPDAPSTPQH